MTGNTKRSMRSVAVALAAAASLALAACSSSTPEPSDSSAPDLGTVVLGVVPDATTAPLVVAAEQGLFEKYGLTPELKIFSSGGAANQALAAGDIDLSASGQYAVVNNAAAGAGIDVLAVLSTADRQVGLVANESIASIDDLAGKKIGVQEGSTAHLYLIILQKKTGLEFTVENVGNDQIIAAFANNQVDAIVTWQPNVDRAVEAVRGSKVLAFSGDDAVMPLVTYLLASTDFAADDAKVEAAVKAIEEASAWAAANEDDLVELLAGVFDVDESAIAGTVAVFAFEFGWDSEAERFLSEAAEVVEEQRGITIDLASILKVDAAR